MSDSQTSDSIEQLCQRLHNNTSSELAEIAASNRDLASKSDKYWATSGDVTITFSFVYETLYMTLTFKDGTILTFNGTAPSIGLGGTGAGHGAAVFNTSPQQLLSTGKYSFRAKSAGLLVSGIEVQWFEHRTVGTGPYVGTGLFGGLGVGAGISLGGSGSFTS